METCREGPFQQASRHVEMMITIAVITHRFIDQLLSQFLHFIKEGKKILKDLSYNLTRYWDLLDKCRHRAPASSQQSLPWKFTMILKNADNF